MESLWKDVPGFEGLYIVNELGIVKGVDRIVYRSDGVKQTYKESIKKQSISKRGYYYVTLSKDGKSTKVKIHRLIGKLFIPNPENKPQLNHIDGNKLNNSLDNLEWVTNKENSNHAIYSGLIDNKGSKNGMSKLTEEEVIDIRNMKHSGMFNIKEIAYCFKVSETCIYNIINRKRWNHI